MVPLNDWFRWFRRGPTAVATSSVEAADRLGVSGKVSQLLRIIQNSQDYSELLEWIAVRPH
jgi:hypothetical protein